MPIISHSLRIIISDFAAHLVKLAQRFLQSISGNAGNCQAALEVIHVESIRDRSVHHSQAGWISLACEYSNIFWMGILDCDLRNLKAGILPTMDDKNRLFALKQVVDSEVAIRAATGERRDYPWGSLVTSPEFPGYAFGNVVLNFNPAPQDDTEELLREASALVADAGGESLVVVFAPDLVGDEITKRLEEELFLLDFKSGESEVYAWVKSQKIKSNADIEIHASEGKWDDYQPIFDDERNDRPPGTSFKLNLNRDRELEGYSTWFASLEGKLAGRLGYLNLGVCGRLRSLYVDKALRRRGVGAALVSHTVQLARDNENLIIGLITEKDNPARYLFVNLGFTPIGELRIYKGALL